MRMWPIGMILALGLTGTDATAADQPPPHLQGVWNVSVAVRNCETGRLSEAFAR